jgi:hypothetical protein
MQARDNCNKILKNIVKTIIRITCRGIDAFARTIKQYGTVPLPYRTLQNTVRYRGTAVRYRYCILQITVLIRMFLTQGIERSFKTRISKKIFIGRIS